MIDTSLLKLLLLRVESITINDKKQPFFFKLEHPNSHSYKISVYLSLPARNLCFRSCGKTSSIEVRPILCSIRKIRFLCNFTGPPLENFAQLFQSVSNTNIIKFREKILKEKNKFFAVKKIVNFKRCRLQYVAVYLCTLNHRNTCTRSNE